MKGRCGVFFALMEQITLIGVPDSKEQMPSVWWGQKISTTMGIFGASSIENDGIDR